MPSNDEDRLASLCYASHTNMEAYLFSTSNASCSYENIWQYHFFISESRLMQILLYIIVDTRIDDEDDENVVIDQDVERLVIVTQEKALRDLFSFWKIQERNNQPIDIGRPKRFFQCISSGSNGIHSIEAVYTQNSRQLLYCTISVLEVGYQDISYLTSSPRQMRDQFSFFSP
ncbi:hypothetical protein WN944_009736 [Citrus x changshan-huyou]|uniref:Uncharacterized protein n=1 Tax=Citrus x changshan-huyou TaxID=2935761 RepID=A0AAP0MQC2_9ROSI